MSTDPDLCSDDAYVAGVRDGYSRGEYERASLARECADLRTDLLALRHELARLTVDTGHG